MIDKINEIHSLTGKISDLYKTIKNSMEYEYDLCGNIGYNTIEPMNILFEMIENVYNKTDMLSISLNQ